MTEHPGDGTVQSESGLSEDAFSPVWGDDDRPRIPRVAAEREALAAYLDYFRATLEVKCRDLTPEQARTRSRPPPNYEDVYKLTNVRGPSGILVMLAQELKKS